MNSPKIRQRTLELDLPIVGGRLVDVVSPNTPSENPTRLRRDLRSVEATVGEGEVFVDRTGGNGIVAMAASLKVGPGGIVVAEEPDAFWRRCIWSNIARTVSADRRAGKGSPSVLVVRDEVPEIPGDPEASVVIPARNAARTIAAQLEALSAQRNAPPFEVIVALNRCTDDTERIARSFGERLDIRLIDASEVAGAAFARNEGARAARGAFVLHCDADDIVHDDWLVRIVQALGEFDIVAGAVAPLDEHQRSSSVLRLCDPTKPQELFGVHLATGANVGYRREVLLGVPGHPEDFTRSQDSAFTLEVLYAGGRFGFAPHARVSYRQPRTVRALVRQRLHWGWWQAELINVYLPLERRPLVVELVAAARSLSHASRSIRSERLVAAAAIAERVGRTASIVRLWAAGRWSSAEMRGSHWRRMVAQGLVTARLDQIEVIREWTRAASELERLAETTIALSVPVCGGRLVTAPIATVPTIHRHGGPDAQLVVALNSLVSQGDTVVVVGAGIGVFVLAAAELVGRSGTVVAIEGDPMLRSCLERNVRRARFGDRVRVVDAERRPKTGTAALVVIVDATQVDLPRDSGSVDPRRTLLAVAGEQPSPMMLGTLIGGLGASHHRVCRSSGTGTANHTDCIVLVPDDEEADFASRLENQG